MRHVKGLRKSVAKFEEFQRKKPKNLIKVSLDFDVPFVRIGRVPVITYESSKEGKRRFYKHNTKHMPTLFMHPTKPIGLLLGGSLKVKEWLYD